MERKHSKPSRLLFTKEEQEHETSSLPKPRQKRPKVSAAKDDHDTDKSKPKESTLLIDVTKGENPPKTASHLRFEEHKPKPPSKLKHSISNSILGELHRQVAVDNEDENVAVTAVNEGVTISRSTAHTLEEAQYSHKLRKYRRTQADRPPSAHDASSKAAQPAAQQSKPIFQSNPLSRWQQKRAIRRQYAANVGKGAQTTGRAAQNVGQSARKTTKSIAEKFQSNPKVLALGLLAAMLLMVMIGLQSCTPMVQSVLQSIVIGTYPADEEDVRDAERAYREKELELQDEMDHYLIFHPEYDECEIEADEIWHDPYVLIAIISAYFDGEEWDIARAMPVINKYFDLQYVVTKTVQSEIRYNQEQRLGTRVVTDANGHTHTETYTYTENIPYTYRTVKVKLENKNLSHLPVVSMSHHTMGMYALYMASHGNMEGIFSGPHATPLRDPYIYDIPQATLDANPTFARLMEEANKYVGYPYVWGGASPETSFDCSGFVCYVYTTSGVYNTGRLGATGLYNLCRRVANDAVQPGDLVFFEGTIAGDEGISHCGIYVGNGHMIHCGSPLGYADLSESYWQHHFHSYGRIPY